jgi:poly(3-hydroxybutyrate) depolymerase
MKIIKIIGIVFGILIGIIVLYLIIVIFAPGFNVARQPLPISESTTKDMTDKPLESRKDVSFEVRGIQVSAWLYLPQDLSVPIPCIIMNHGFGGTKDMILQSYALRFQKAGFAVGRL